MSMISKVKVLGAGSIGNHLSHASRTLGWAVDLCDVDPAALERTRTQIFPARYGHWDETIGLFVSQQAPQGDYDLICVGTPPDTHMALALAAVAEKPKAVLVEKPLCGPDLAQAQTLYEAAHAAGVAVFTGYDHVVGLAAQQAAGHLAGLGKLLTLDVEFREYWGGIFAAHPWLAGPWESYLGFWKRGGGASGEHSHAANLWAHFAHVAGAGRITEVEARMDFVRDGRVDYDRLCLMTFATEHGLVGRCVQDVVTQPPRKWARAQGETGFIEWQCGVQAGVDQVTGQIGDQPVLDRITKTRPDDFIAELRHIDACLESGAPSPISLERGLDTMMVIAAAHISHQEGRRVRIDYAKGYRPEALQ